MKKLRLILVDDQAMFREGLRMLLSLQPDFEIVGEASDGTAAIELARRVVPDVILMDLRMPEMDGAEATRRIKAEVPAVRVIVLTTFEDDEEVFAAIRAGAVGYLLKASPAEKVYEAIRLAAPGELFLEPSVTAKLVTEFNRRGSPTRPLQVAPLLEPLSERENEVLLCLAEGMSNKEIGRRLNIAEGTVKNHMSQVLSKLQVFDRTQAALRARELGFL
ncbi:MAG TPA: response regulator transcription factor [Opitutaceae bacterium]|jgi:DNA-binding NarL/FixJ family response regulator|nr:response regulator transcription factor [Opitutaceae bacterium]